MNVISPARSIRFRVLRNGVLGIAILGGVLLATCGEDDDPDPPGPRLDEGVHGFVEE